MLIGSREGRDWHEGRRRSGLGEVGLALIMANELVDRPRRRRGFARLPYSRPRLGGCGGGRRAIIGREGRRTGVVTQLG